MMMHCREVCEAVSALFDRFVGGGAAEDQARGARLEGVGEKVLFGRVAEALDAHEAQKTVKELVGLQRLVLRPAQGGDALGIRRVNSGDVQTTNGISHRSLSVAVRQPFADGVSPWSET